MSQLKEEISQVPLPEADPVEGHDGVLTKLWSEV